MSDVNDGPCNVAMGSSGANKIVFGAGGTGSDANYMMMHASVALHYPCAVGGSMIFNIDAENSGTQFTLLNGFHNSPGDEIDNAWKIDDFLYWTTDTAVGDCWGDIMTLRNGFVHECSVSVITSSSSANADQAFIYGGLSDFKDTGSHAQHWYYYDCGRPKCASELSLCQ